MSMTLSAFSVMGLARADVLVADDGHTDAVELEPGTCAEREADAADADAMGAVDREAAAAAAEADATGARDVEADDDASGGTDAEDDAAGGTDRLGEGVGRAPVVMVYVRLYTYMLLDMSPLE